MRRSLTFLTLAVLGLLLPHGAHAITNGEPDSEHDYVGAFIGSGTDPATGEPASGLLCTGTVIAPRVVLTAAHCFLDLEQIGVDQVHFTLAEVLDADRDTVIDDGLRLIPGTAVPHPDAWSGGRSNPHDIAVFLLDSDAGVAPATLPTSDYLADPSVRDDTFLAVGYGLTRVSHQQAEQAIRLTNRRLQAEQTLSSLTKAWATFSMNQARDLGGGCYGDSGGPHLHGDVVVSLTVLGDRFCKATDKTYRVDTPWAREFLGRFVTLP